jgi:hypothetical protein
MTPIVIDFVLSAEATPPDSCCYVMSKNKKQRRIPAFQFYALDGCVYVGEEYSTSVPGCKQFFSSANTGTPVRPGSVGLLLYPQTFK